MERLIQHLEQLIIQHDYAILPEFGGFIVNYVPAKMDELKNLVSAPRKEVFFNPALNYNDGLLAGSVQRTENITFRKANLIVRDSVADLKKRLKNGETIILERIGSLRLDENGQTEFLPSDSYDFLPDNIGNYDIRLRVSHKEDEETKQIVLNLPANKRHLYKYAAAIAVVVALAVLAPVLHMHFSPYLAKLNPLALFQQDSVATDSSHKHLILKSVDSSKLKNDSLTQRNDSCKKQNCKMQCKAPWHVIAGSYPTKGEAINNARNLQQQVPGKKVSVAYSTRLKTMAVTPAPTGPQSKAVQQPIINPASWHVIVGNFETEKKAKQFVADMEKAHKMKLSIYGANYVYRIVAASFVTEKEASVKLVEIRKIADFQGSWLLHNTTLLNHPVGTPATAPAKPAVLKPAAATPQKSATTEQINTAKWHVVIANYSLEKQAKQYAETTGKKEHVALNVVKDKKLYRVLAGSFDSKEAAVAKIKELHKYAEFAEAWVLHKPNFK